MTIHPAEVWRKAFSPPDRRSIIEWAAEKITLPSGPLAKSGKFDVSESRHFIAPLQAIRHDRVRGVRIMAPVRGGKTLIADVAVPWAILNDNASVLWVFQERPIAEAHAEARQMPILKSVPDLRMMLSADRHKTRKADILFANGLPFVLTGPALGGLQSRGFKWVVCDEPWMYKPNVLGNAKARQGDFVKMASNKFIALSQGGEEESDWHREYKAGVEYVWRPKCEGCSEPMPLEWTLNREDGAPAGVVYDSVKREDGTYDIDACAESVRFVCPHCGHSHANTARTRSAWNESGWFYRSSDGERFDDANPPTEISFRWHALIDNPWDALVKLWIEAQSAKRTGDFGPLVLFFQKYCALMRSEYSVQGTDLPFARIQMDLTNPAERSWPDEAMRFLTVDKQSEGLYWATIRAWSRAGESRRLWFGRLYGEAAIEAKRIEYNVSPKCTVIDAGYEATGPTGVYAACSRYGWIAAKGDKAKFYWHIVKRGGRSERVQRPWAPPAFGDPNKGAREEGKVRVPLIMFSAPTTAERVHALIDRSLWVEPIVDDKDEDEMQYRIQMSAEFKKPKSPNSKEMIWVCPSKNNHAFDCAKMQVLCAMYTKLLPAGVELSAAKDNNEQEKEAA